MEIKPPEYSYIHFSDEEAAALHKVVDILFEFCNPKNSDNKYEIRCIDEYCELDAIYNDDDIYKAYRMMAEFLEDTLKYYPRNKEECKNGN